MRHYKAFQTAAEIPMEEKDDARLNSIPSATRKRMSGSTPRIVLPENPGLLARFVTGSSFDYITGLFIVLNAASIGAQTDYMATHITDVLPTAYRAIEIVFCVVFTLELLMRIAVYRIRFFCMPDWKWNMFDTIVVILQLVEEFLGIIMWMVSAEGAVQTDFSAMRILKVLRLIRIIRLVRILRLIGELRTIVVSIIGSLRSLFWTMLLLLLVIYLVAVYVTQLISDHRIELREEDPQSIAAMDGVENFCGSLGMTILTLYQAITGGLSWQVLTEPILKHIGPWTSIVICMYIGFSLFALMNIVTGVFVESALATAKSDKDLFLLHFVKKLFQQADKDQSGSVTWEEFRGCLGSDEMKMYFEALDLDVGEAQNLFNLLDISGTGSVQFEDFVNGCFRLRGGAKALDLATFMDAFHRWHKKWEPFAKRMDFRLKHLVASDVGEKVPYMPPRDVPRHRITANSMDRYSDASATVAAGLFSDDSALEEDNCDVFLGELERGNI